MTAREDRIELLLCIRLVATTRKQSSVLEVCEVYQVVVELDLRAVCEDRFQCFPSALRRLLYRWTALLFRELDDGIGILTACQPRSRSEERSYVPDMRRSACRRLLGSAPGTNRPSILGA